MKKILSPILKYQWLILLNLYLILPIFFSLGITRGFDSIHDPVIWWNLACSVAFLLGLQLLIRKPFSFHLFMLPFYLTVSIDIFTIFVFDSRLSSGYIWIILANMSNWNDFFQTFYREIITGTLLFLIIYTFLLWKIRSLSFSHHRMWSFIPLTMFFALYGGLTIHQAKVHKTTLSSAFVNVVEHDFSSPFGVISQMSVTYLVLQKSKNNLQKRKDFVFNAKKEPLAKPEIYVMVIGETSRRDHWAINGYHRNTSPQLNKVEKLISFKDVITEWSLTQKSVPIMLSLATISDFDRATTEKSIITAYKEAKFKTYWLTTQPFDHFAGNIHVIANDADVVRYFVRKYDAVLLDALDNVFNDFKEKNEKIFIILHTKGSHFEFSKRYPPEFKKYPDSSEFSWKEKLVNRYDNTILYTDFFLSRVISALKAQNTISAMLYVSDHGENLMDDERKLQGHNFGNQYDLPIPMFFWYSDEYEKIYPKKVINVKKNIEKKLGTINVFHSLADMANIQIDEMLDKNLSFFHAPMQEVPRIVYIQNRNKFIDYDLIEK
ncbi:MAG: phosphoethanolamine transferase [Candidatus Marithrix sp.]|nr:phosphoethanolamine transferase [Candidatus Marithrix sp.]